MCYLLRWLCGLPPDGGRSGRPQDGCLTRWTLPHVWLHLGTTAGAGRHLVGQRCVCIHMQDEMEGARRGEGKVSYDKKGSSLFLHLCWWSGVSLWQAGEAGPTLGAVLVTGASGEGSLAVGASDGEWMKRRRRRRKANK